MIAFSSDRSCQTLIHPLEYLSSDWVWTADNSGLSDSIVLNQGILHLKWTYAVPVKSVQIRP